MNDDSINFVTNDPALRNAAEASHRRVSWAAIISGVVIALVAQLVLNILGIGIGASTIDPLKEQNPLSGIGMGAGIWYAVVSLLSLFVGGWVAGRLAGVPRALDSMLHGVLAWGLATLFTFYLLTTAIGGLLGGTANMLGRATTFISKEVAQVAPGIAKSIGQSGSLGDQFDWTSLKSEALSVLRQTGKTELNPNRIEQKAKNAQSEATNSAETAAKNPQVADDEFFGLVQKYVSQGTDAANAVDKQAVVNVLKARTEMTDAQANETVDKWLATYESAKVKLQQTAVEAEQKAREVGDAAARGASQSALWTFAALMLGAIAAGLGGYLSSSRTSSRRNRFVTA